MPENPPTFHIWTIGCQMNVADSAHLAAALEAAGYREAAAPEDADVVVLNSCVVRGHAEERVRGKLASLKGLKRRKPHLVLGLTGCMVEHDLTDLRRAFPHVDVFFPPRQVDRLLEVLRAAELVREFSVADRPQGVTAYVPVIYGCNNFCTYCIVPYRRGRELSRSPEEIEEEVRRLVARGVREVTLLGQNVDSYGHDLPEPTDLAALLRRLNPLDGLWRLRFLTNHPKDMSDRLIAAMAELPKVCESINLPVQAGDDETLRRMGRGYTVAQYRDLVARLRAGVPGLSLTTDLIVGFPGETDEQFANSCRLLEELRFYQVHVAAYSPRPGTAAARLPDDVPPEVKRERLQAVEAVETLQEGIARALNAELVDQTVEVLVERAHKGKWTGRTRTDRIVFFENEADLAGKLVDARVTGGGPWSLQGEFGRVVAE